MSIANIGFRLPNVCTLTYIQEIPIPIKAQPNNIPQDAAFLIDCVCKRLNNIIMPIKAHPGRWAGANPRGIIMPAKTAFEPEDLSQLYFFAINILGNSPLARPGMFLYICFAYPGQFFSWFE